MVVSKDLLMVSRSPKRSVMVVVLSPNLHTANTNQPETEGEKTHRRGGETRDQWG